MKKVHVISATMAAMVLAFGLAACSGGSSSAPAAGEGSSAPDEAPAAAEASAPVEAPAPEAAAEAASDAVADAAAATIAAADLATVTDTIEFGDYDGMKALSSAIQNGEKVGAVVQIDGLVSNFAKGMSYNIVEENAEGSGNIGTTFKIEGVDEDAYPSDGTHVKLTGLVVDEGGMMFTIHTLPEFVEVVE